MREIFQNFCLEVITDVNTYAATLFVLTIKSVSVNSMSFIWNDNMREKREANANAT
jgi:hypothetical protein